ncbi:MAG: acyl-CoA dehydrogenase family protein [Rhodoferax sp.]|nr:acyl-CoA dehydrogenase family protein [Rhodoferax sp.]
MSDTQYLNWPFFAPHHPLLARALDAWAQVSIRQAHGTDVDAECRALVKALGQAGWLRHAVGGTAYGGVADAIDTRSICLIRETLARHSGLADFAFAMQGLGSGAISLAGSQEQKQTWLPRVAKGEAIAAFALSEPDAGSDVAAMQCSARIEGDHAVLNGSKTWISNGGIADFYVVFARTGVAPGEGLSAEPLKGSRGISAFIVDANTPGLEIAERIQVMAPHPLATLRFTECRVPLSRRIGAAGEGFKIAMRTLDVFRTSVAAAALGFARRALDEAMDRATTRKIFGQTLGDFQLTQAKLAQMAATIDASALLTYRAAWQRDQGLNVTKEAAMAKMVATEGAQQVIDAAVQIWGGMGVVSDHPVERLYREIRALRIYEGATEVQQLIIARELLKSHQPQEA